MSVWVVAVLTCSVSCVTQLSAKIGLIPYVGRGGKKRERNWSAGKERKESLFYLICLIKQGWLGKGRTVQYKVIKEILLEE